MMDVCFDTTRTAFSLVLNGSMKKYPNIRFILAHAGGAVPYIAGRVNMLSTMFSCVGGVEAYVASGIGAISSIVPKLKERLPENLSYYLKYKDVMKEGPDFYLKKFYYDTALSASPHVFSSLKTLVESSQVVFGSDYIFATEAAIPLTIKGIERYAGFSAEERAAIKHENAIHLFPRLKKQSWT